MSHKGNVAVVLFNPSLTCIEQVLEFIAEFKKTHSELHILSDLEQPESGSKHEDLLVLELSLPKEISQQLLAYITQLYPDVSACIINEPNASGSKGTLLSSRNGFKNKLPLTNHSFDLN